MTERYDWSQKMNNDPVMYISLLVKTRPSIPVISDANSTTPLLCSASTTACSPSASMHSTRLSDAIARLLPSACQPPSRGDWETSCRPRLCRKTQAGLKIVKTKARLHFCIVQ